LPVTEKPISASILRKWIREGNIEWKNHIPKAVIEYLEKNGLLKRVENPLS
jgi:citrate lyase synthetase